VALGNRGEAGAVPALATALASDPDALVRMHAAWALGEIGRGIGAEIVAPAVDEVARGLRDAAGGDPSPEVREEATAALARLD
jgi:HEAT repeat protein